MPQPKPAPMPLSDDQRREVADRMATCPFIGPGVALGLLEVLNTTDLPLASIEDVARLGDSGGGNLGSHVLTLFARGNHARVLPAGAGENEFVPEGTFSLQFGGSQGAHPGHSGILLGDPKAIGEGRLDLVAFERLASRADRNGRLSIDVVGDFIAENLKRDPDSSVLPFFQLVRDAVRLLGDFGEVLFDGSERRKTEAFVALTKLLGEDNLMGSSGEWGLLFAFLKNSPRSDDWDIALDEVRMMFVEKQFPEGWETWRKDGFDWVRATLRLTKDAAFAYHFGWE